MNRELQELVESTTRKLGLIDPAFVEKDYYVTQVLHAINKVDNKNFNLVFIGGTCLTKAHKVVQRMSEDIDFKVVSKEPHLSLKTNSARDKLSGLREEILMHIRNETGFFPKEGQINKGNNNRFTQILLDYDAFYPINPALRPQIKIELTAQTMHLPPEKLVVSSLIHQVIGDSEYTPSQEMFCISTNETAIEKWSALCRYASSSTHDIQEFDYTIVRHLFDLCCIEKTKKISTDFEKLAPFVLSREMERIKGLNPYFFENPLAEIQKGFEHFAKSSVWKDAYQQFVINMVFQVDPPEFQEALQTFEKLHDRAIDAISGSGLSNL